MPSLKLATRNRSFLGEIKLYEILKARRSNPKSPALSTKIPSPPSPSSAPSSDKCHIAVNELDHTNPSNHGEEIWNVSVYPDTGEKLKDSSFICMAGVDADERSGVDVKCDPPGQVFHLHREKDDALRIIWGAQTWMADDKRCKSVKDWYIYDTTQADKRKRETECTFECKIDWTVPPSIVVV
jgi:hypothetical protein